jgi:hypothetical protein
VQNTKPAVRWAELLSKPMQDRDYFTDAEAETLSGVSVASLRRLQALGLLRAQNAPRVGGGYGRVWPRFSVFRAAVAGDVNHYTGWDYRDVAPLLAGVPHDLWQGLIADEAKWGTEEKLFEEDAMLVEARDTDYRLSVLNRRLVCIHFVEIPGSKNPAIPIGSFDFQARAYIWPEIGTASSAEHMQALGEEARSRYMAEVNTFLHRELRRALEVEGSRVTVNLGIPVRRVLRRMRGLRTLYPDAMRTLTGRA